MTANSRIRAASPRVASPSGICAGSASPNARASVQASRTIRARHMMIPQKPCHALCPTVMKLVETCCQSRNVSIRSSTPAPTISCLPSGRALNRSMPESFLAARDHPRRVSIQHSVPRTRPRVKTRKVRPHAAESMPEPACSPCRRELVLFGGVREGRGEGLRRRRFAAEEVDLDFGDVTLAELRVADPSSSVRFWRLTAGDGGSDVVGDDVCGGFGEDAGLWDGARAGANVADRVNARILRPEVALVDGHPTVDR